MAFIGISLVAFIILYLLFGREKNNPNPTPIFLIILASLLAGLLGSGAFN